MNKNASVNLTPYTHWNRLYKTKDAMALLNVRIFGDNTLFLLPNDSLMYVRAFIGENTCMQAYLHYTLDEAARMMCVDAVEVIHMDQDNHTGLGSQMSDSLEYFTQCFKRYFLVSERLVWRLFGSDWHWDIARESCEAIREEHVQYVNARLEAMNDLLNRPPHPPYTGMSNVYGAYNLASVHKAASKIAAAFRGWNARKTYRMNPRTSLGRFLALRGFSELEVVS